MSKKQDATPDIISTWGQAWGREKKQGYQDALELQPCGHPVACIEGGNEDTHYCGWCASLANMTIAIECPNCGTPFSTIKVDELDGLHSGVTVHCSKCAKPISFTGLRDGWVGYAGELVTQAIAVARADERERCASECDMEVTLADNEASWAACQSMRAGTARRLARHIRALDKEEEPKCG